MRKIAFVALASVLMLAGVAAAQVRSTPTSFTDSSLDVNVGASGHIVSAAVFTIPSASVTIPLGTITPGMTFTLDIPVTNPTSALLNPVAVTMDYTGNPDYQTYFTIAPTSATSFSIAAGGTVDVTYQIHVSDSLPVRVEDTSLASGDVGYTFHFTAHGSIGPSTNGGGTYVVGSGF